MIRLFRLRRLAPALTRLNERFTALADTVSEGIGEWWVTAISVLVVLLWLASGPLFRFSDTWQLMINTPTTVLEMWLGFLIAAAANRVERRNDAMLEKIEAQEERMDLILESIAKLLATDHAEHGRLLRELHSHITCKGHTTIGEE